MQWCREKRRMSQYAKKLDLLRGVGPFLMGRVVILPQAFPLRLCLCRLGGRGWGCRLVMEEDCGTRKSTVLGDVAPVTGTQRAVTHCDRACTNAQRLNSPHNSPLSRLLLAVVNNGSCPLVSATICRQRLPSAPVMRLSHRTHPREPSSLHQPAP